MTWNVRGSRLSHIMNTLPARRKFIGFHEISCPPEAQWAAKGGYFTTWSDHGRMRSGRCAAGCALATRHDVGKEWIFETLVAARFIIKV